MTSPSAGGRPSLSEAFATTPRLKVAAFLAGCAEADFATITEVCELTPATLSKAATTLENAGYLRIRKGHVGRRPRTWLSLTKAGRSAFEGHLAALSHLTEQGQSVWPGPAGGALRWRSSAG